MGGVLCDIPALSAFPACHCRVNELRWSNHGRYHLYCVGRLVHTRAQTVCAAAG